MEQKKIVLTKQGKEDLLKELKNIKEVEKPAILTRLEEARAQGDLSENSDYDAARVQQGQVEARIREIEYIINNCEVIDESKKTNDKVQIGSQVTIYRVDTGKEITYTVVGETEADPLNNKISNDCILAKSILGKPVSEEKITVNAKNVYSVVIKSIK